MSLESEQKIKYEDNPDFNEVIDNENGSPLIIRGAELAHSYILYKLQPDIYQMALADHREQRLDEIQHLAFDHFPPLIAYNYRLSVRGPGANDPVKRFLHLKDAWEGAINILYALVLGEVRTKSINLQEANVYNYPQKVDHKRRYVKVC